MEDLMDTIDSTDRQDGYLVVRNDEDQYSIWRSAKDIPAGWHAIGTPRSEDEALAWIEENWTDMRPRSVRDAVSARQG
jgi:MbtH protein